MNYLKVAPCERRAKPADPTNRARGTRRTRPIPPADAAAKGTAGPKALSLADAMAAAPVAIAAAIRRPDPAIASPSCPGRQICRAGHNSLIPANLGQIRPQFIIKIFAIEVYTGQLAVTIPKSHTPVQKEPKDERTRTS